MGKILESFKAGVQSASIALSRMSFPKVKKGGSIGVTTDDLRIYRTFSSLLREKADMVQKPYEQVGWVYASISLIAQNAARLPFKLYKGEENDPSVVEQGKLYDLFMRPNPYMIQETLIEATVTYLELRGECFWIIERDNITQIPKEIWVFDPLRFEPYFNEEKRMVTGWFYNLTATEKIPFKMHEIIHFKHFHPEDPIRGFPTLKAIDLAVQQDYNTSIYNNAYFKNGAKVGGYISVPTDLDDDSFNRIAMQFEDRHRGATKAHLIAVLDNGATFQEARVTQKDMDFIALKQLTREEIFGAFKVNAVVMGLYEYIQCFHPDTEVMTDKGFKSVVDVKEDDLIASCNNGVVEFKPVTNVYTYDVDGDMYTQKKTQKENAYGTYEASLIDYCVTPEHKMFGKERRYLTSAGEYKTKDFIFKRVSEISEQDSFCSPRNGQWDGKVVELFEIEKGEYGLSTKNGSKNGLKETTFPIIPWLKFLGWFISEGCFKNETNFEMIITQSKDWGINQIREDLKDFPYKVREDGKDSGINFTFSGKDLYNYLIENVGHYSHERRIPREVLELHPSLLQHLFDALMAGDGTKFQNTRAFFYKTTSEGLASDIQELGIRLGLVPILMKMPELKNCYPNAKPCWGVRIPGKRFSESMAKVMPVKTSYKGKVYCFEVPPYHTVLTRYNGKVMWIGQSYEGVKTAYKVFWEECLVPKINYIQAVLWANFFYAIEGGEIWGAFDTATVGPLMDAYGEKVLIAKDLEAMGWPINAINKRLGLGFRDVPWGNTSWKSMNTAPAENLMDNEPSDTKPIADTPNNGKDPDDGDDDTDAKKDSVKNRDLLNKRYIAVQGPIEKLMEGKLKKFIFEQRKKVLGLPVYTQEIVNQFFMAEEKRLINLFQPLYTIAMTAGNEMVLEEISGTEKSSGNDSVYSLYINNRLNFIPSKIVQTMKKMVVNVIGKEAKSSPELLDRLRIVYNSIASRSLLIARTESANCLSGARVITMLQEGFKYHQWVSFTKTREAHSAIDGTILKIGESFKPDVTLRFPGDMLASADEVIGCRCFTIPIKQ